MQDNLNSRECAGWSFAALSVLCALRLSGLGWLYVLLGAAAAAAYFFLLSRLRGSGEAALSDLALTGFGKQMGSVLLLLCAAWTVLVLASVIAAAATAFPEEDVALQAALAAAALTAIACSKGLRSCAGAAGTLALLLMVLYSVIVLASVKQIEPQWCRPRGSVRDALQSFAFLLLPSCILFLPRKKEQPPRAAWYLIPALVPAIPAFVCAACLSPGLTAVQTFPFYTLSKSLSLLSVMERFEPLLSGAMLMGFVCLAMLLAQTAGNICGSVLGEKRKKTFGIAAAAAGFALSFVIGRLPTAFWIFGATIFWGLFPALTQFVGGSKILSEKVKKEVDKTGFL